MSFKPKPYAVYVRIAEYPDCGFKGEYVSRIGPADTVKKANEMIAADRRAMGDTLGGLIPAVSTKGRNYEIWKASWEKVGNEENVR